MLFHIQFNFFPFFLNFKPFNFVFDYFKDSPPPLDIHHMESEGEGAHSPDSDWTVLPLDQDCDTIVPNPPWFGKPTTSPPTSKLKKLRLKGKDYKKGGDGLRGKNVIEAYRVKEKDLKRTMK